MTILISAAAIKTCTLMTALSIWVCAMSWSRFWAHRQLDRETPVLGELMC